jgi:hypothetical protein
MKLINKLNKPLYDPVLSCTVPVLTELKPGIPGSIGTGIFIKIQDEYYFISAKHVFEQSKGIIIVPSSEVCIRISGNILFFSGDGSISGSVKDHIDIGVMKIDKNLDKVCKQYKFFPLDKNLHLDLIEKEKFLVVGYPCSRYKVNPTNKSCKAETFLLQTSVVDKKIYSKNSSLFDINTHIVLKYDIKNVTNIQTGQIINGWKPNGLSGCGVWNFTNIGNVPHCSLASILIEYYKELKIFSTVRFKHIYNYIITNPNSFK